MPRRPRRPPAAPPSRPRPSPDKRVGPPGAVRWGAGWARRRPPRGRGGLGGAGSGRGGGGRRPRRRTAARAALGEALETATRIGAARLAVRAGDELARLDAGDRSGEAAGGP